MTPHIMNANGTISIMIDGAMKPIDTAHKNYEAIKDAIKAQEWDIIPDLVNIAKEVEEAIQSSPTLEDGVVTIVDGEVLYNGFPVHNSLTDRIVSMASEGFDIAHMVKFLEALMTNPSYRAVNELYGFLEAGSIPITENGTFLAYKKITSDYKDIYTGKIDNSVGKTIRMPRNMVNEDSEQTCSAGLHVCSYDYLPSFGTGGGSRVVICEINPRDVVSIPQDYNNTKMRCCEYTIIGEVTDYQSANILAENSVVDTDDVNSGKVSGTVDHSPEAAKRIGKMISNELDDGEITATDLANILKGMNVEEFEVQNIQAKADDGLFKKVGKAISSLIKSGSLNGMDLEHAVVANKPTDAEPPMYEVEEDEECDRCGGDITDGECESCGYYQG